MQPPHSELSRSYMHVRAAIFYVPLCPLQALLAGIYNKRREDKLQEALLPASAAYLWGNSSYGLEKSNDLEDLTFIVSFVLS